MRRIAQWCRDHFGLTILAVVVIAFGIRVIYIVVVNPHTPLGLDAAWYEIEGHALAGGRGYIDPRVFLQANHNVPTANFPPLWSMVLAVADRIGMGTEMRNRIVGAVLGSVTVALSGLVARRVAGTTVGVGTAILVACCPMLIAADGSLMSESLYVTLITATVLCTYIALDKPTPWRFAAVGLLLGLAALTRTDALVLVPILLGILIWGTQAVAVPRRTGLVAAAVLALAIPMGSWTAYSSSRMGGLVATTSNSGNMLSGANCHSTYYGPLLGAWDERCARNFAPGGDELAWAAEARSVGIDYARDHPSRLPIVAGARVLRTWGLWAPLSQARLEAVETRNVKWQLLGWGYDIALLAAGIAGTIVLVRRRARIAPLVAVVVGVTITAAVSNGNQRFRLAADPVVALAAAVALTAAVGSMRTRSPCELREVGRN